MRSRSSTRIWLSSVAIALLTVGCFPAAAQQSPSALQREFEALFQRLLQDPSDREANRRFVEVSLLLEDYEAAIGSLERLLFYDPDNAGLNLQIGELYLKIGSYVVARGYAERARALSAADPDLTARTETLIAETERLTRPAPFSVFAQTGLRYQTNANSGPERLDGADGAADMEEDDWNAFGLVGIGYARRVGDIVLEAGLSGYYAEQFEIDRLDLGFAELNVGPRIFVAPEASPNLSVKPFAVVGGTFLADYPYLRTIGAGISARFPLGEMATLEPSVDYRDRLFYDSPEYPTANDQTGHLVTYALAGVLNVTDDARLSTRVAYQKNEARAEDNSYDQIAAEASWRFRFDPLARGGDLEWVLTPSATVSWREYAAPDPAVDPDVTRQDFEWRTGARLEIPATEQLGLGLQVQYTRNHSNQARFDYDNLQATIGPTVRF